MMRWPKTAHECWACQRMCVELCTHLCAITVFGFTCSVLTSDGTLRGLNVITLVGFVPMFTLKLKDVTGWKQRISLLHCAHL